MPSRSAAGDRLCGRENAPRLTEQIARYRPQVVAMASADALRQLRRESSSGTEFAAPGRQGLADVATHPDVDTVLCASAGTEALEAVLAAIEAHKTIALANKESLVMRRRGIVMDAAGAWA
jgi:1-deoxy-D-xylulose-5-phosphate reductoisomerase